MFKYTIVLFLVLVDLLSADFSGWASTSVVNSSFPEVTVFIYHRFGESKYPSTSVAMDRFKEQMAYLMANNYQVISLAEMVKRLQKQEPLPARAAVITIDDGYKSVYHEAWPVLKSFGFPFTVFVYVKAVDSGYSDFMTWDQIKEMKTAGVDFQDHGYSHKRLGNIQDGMDESQYRAWISADLVKSSRIMMERLGDRPEFFAIPYGEYNQVVIDEAKAMGYSAVLSQDPGSVSDNTDLFLIPREPILGEDWSTINHFETVLKRVDLPIADKKPTLAPLTINPEMFSARLLFPDLYQENSLMIYVSELGWQRPRFDHGAIFLENARPLTRKMNRIIVQGREKETGRLAISSWMVMKP